MNASVRPILHRLRGVALDTNRQISEAQLFITASSLAYTTILSIVPLLALSFVIFKAFGGLDKVYETLEPFILSNLAEGTSDEVIQRLHSFIDNVHGGTVGIGGFFGLIVTSMSMLMSIENAFNRIWRAKNTRGWFQRIAYYWLFITLGPLALSVALGIASSSNVAISKVLPSGAGIQLIATLGLFIIYKFVPNTYVNWKYALISSFWTGILWSLSRLGYLLYVERFAAYHRIYGSLAAIPIILFWIYLLWLMVLSGAALAAALQHRFGPKTQKTKD